MVVTFNTECAIWKPQSYELYGRNGAINSLLGLDKLPTNVPQVLSEDSQQPQSNEVTDSSGSVSGVGSSVHDSVDYILMNLTEMSKLWVRMQYQGHTKERGLREQVAQSIHYTR